MQINFKIMKNLLPFLFILLLACNQPNDVKLNERIDSLCFVIKQDAYYDSLLIEEVRKEYRTDFHYVSENNELLNWRLERKFHQIDSTLYLKRESKLGRFIGTTIKYLR